MPTPREIRRRIRSVNNISKVTRAMEMVAAAKMRRAQSQVLFLRPYARKAWELLEHLAAQRGANEDLHPLLRHREPVRRTGLVLITSNKGLCGGYNQNVIRHAAQFINANTVPVDLITVGRVGRNAMIRAGHTVIADFDAMPDQPSIMDVRALTRLVIDDFLNGTFDEVQIAYTDFVNTMVQRPHVRPLLPLRNTEGHHAHTVHGDIPPQPALSEFIYEPAPQELLEMILPRFTEMQIYEAILEAVASEQSARMVAMRAATENAHQLVGSLTLTYNQVRQTTITRDILDIVGGVEALGSASR